MIRLIVENSLSRVEGLAVDQFKALRDLMSYTADAGAYFAGGHRSHKRYLMDKKGAFPTGLLYVAEQYLKGRTYEHVERRVRPESQPGLFTLKLPYEPYPEQNLAAATCWERGRGIVSAPTGVGKSVIIAKIIETLQVPTLVVVPGLELKRQLTASLAASFGPGVVGERGMPIAVENVDALDPNVKEPYDAVICDEFHHAAAATYRKLNLKSWTNAYYRFGLTATPFRAQDSERLLLESVLSEVIYRIDYPTAVRKGYIVPIEAYYYELPVQEMRGNDNSWTSVYSELVVNNDFRNRLIAHAMARVGSRGTPTLTLVKEIKHGEILAGLTGVAFANGKDGNTRERVLEFNLGETKQLIGTVGVIGEGVDTKPAEFIFLAAGGKAKTQFMQNCGRGVRVYPGKESCKVVLFRDKSHRFLERHFKACVKYLRDEYGIQPVRLDLPEGFR